jgi:hypothetical protein
MEDAWYHIPAALAHWLKADAECGVEEIEQWVELVGDDRVVLDGRFIG